MGPRWGQPAGRDNARRLIHHADRGERRGGPGRRGGRGWEGQGPTGGSPRGPRQCPKIDTSRRSGGTAGAPRPAGRLLRGTASDGTLVLGGRGCEGRGG